MTRLAVCQTTNTTLAKTDRNSNASRKQETRAQRAVWSLGVRVAKRSRRTLNATITQLDRKQIKLAGTCCTQLVQTRMEDECIERKAMSSLRKGYATVWRVDENVYVSRRSER